MTVSGGPATIGEKELRKDWPVDEGLEAGTTKQVGDASLKPLEEDLTPKRWGKL